MVPNITALLSYKNYPKINISSIKFNDGILAWGANENSKKRFKSNEILWTIQCNQNYSKKIVNLFKNDKNKYIKEIVTRFDNLISFNRKDLIFKNIHGWRYAYSFQNKKLSSLWFSRKNLGICADWISGPKAENAWLNANILFKQIKKNPPKRRV